MAEVEDGRSGCQLNLLPVHLLPLLALGLQLWEQHHLLASPAKPALCQLLAQSAA